LFPLEDFRRSCQGEDAGGCPTPVVVWSKAAGRWRSLPCRRRRCGWCGPHLWKPYALAGLMSGVDAARPGELLFLSLTGPGWADEAWNEGAPERWAVFFERLRRMFPGARLSYWKVGELQKRGVVHYHIVMRGLGFLHHEVLRALAVGAGFGPRVGVEGPREKKGGIRGFCLGYLPKYLVKSVHEWPAGQHVVTHSQDWRGEWRRRRRAPVPVWSYCGSEAEAFRELVIAGFIEVPGRVRERVLLAPGRG